MLQHLSSALNDSDQLLMTEVFCAMDSFRFAIVQSREKELEIEAMCLSGLALIDDKVGYRATPCPAWLLTDVVGQVWKRPMLAKGRYKQCVSMALLLTPKVFHGCEWFDQAESFLKAEQEAQRQKEADEWSEVRKPHLKALEATLAAIDALKDDDVKILKHVYTEHPPKNPKHTQKSGEIKSQYKHALVHYYPDKQDVKEHGAEWKVRSRLKSCRLTLIINHTIIMSEWPHHAHLFTGVV